MNQQQNEHSLEMDLSAERTGDYRNDWARRHMRVTDVRHAIASIAAINARQFVELRRAGMEHCLHARSARMAVEYAAGRLIGMGR